MVLRLPPPLHGMPSNIDGGQQGSAYSSYRPLSSIGEASWVSKAITCCPLVTPFCSNNAAAPVEKLGLSQGAQLEVYTLHSPLETIQQR